MDLLLSSVVALLLFHLDLPHPLQCLGNPVKNETNSRYKFHFITWPGESVLRLEAKVSVEATASNLQNDPLKGFEFTPSPVLNTYHSFEALTRVRGHSGGFAQTLED